MHFIEIEIYGKFEICFVTKELFLSNQPEVVTKRHDFHVKDWNISQQQLKNRRQNFWTKISDDYPYYVITVLLLLLLLLFSIKYPNIANITWPIYFIGKMLS